ncbi:family 43 glycosylhydrolase [Candidatus Leptofilum sp.]|uniref:family 43 glycosylhydrolase n=1 Tax=Candidatus Leptofilum sp. TaxID=3241576 RepID=UPI003B5AF569
MSLYIPDKWVWDFWFAQDGADYHIFYLQAPRALKEERLRHWHVSIGHAVSKDLVNWEILPDALAPSPEKSNAWDNFTTWTGSIIQYDGLWYLFYTGGNRAEKGLIQRIGLATSDDLLTWHKHDNNPVLEADARWYEQLDQALWHDQAWRDPWVFRHNGRFHAFITARGLEGEPSARGVVGHATSDDLQSWQCQPPVAHPQEFGHLEVPQLVEISGRWYLFFCVGYEQFSKARLARPTSKNVIGTHYLVGDTPLGPFKMIEDSFLLADEVGTHYAGKVLRAPKGEWVLMTSLSWTGDGGFIGEIADPIPLKVAKDGRLRVDYPK